jgi:hypothetical protein
MFYILYDLYLGGARSSSVLIGEDGVVTSIYLACSMVVSLTFTSYLSFYKKIITSRKISDPFMYK